MKVGFYGGIKLEFHGANMTSTFGAPGENPTLVISQSPPEIYQKRSEDCQTQ